MNSITIICAIVLSGVLFLTSCETVDHESHTNHTTTTTTTEETTVRQPQFRAAAPITRTVETQSIQTY